MPEVNEYRTKFEAIKQRLPGSNVDIRKLKERLGAVRDSLQRNQEIIDSQRGEIEALGEENGQLSEMLGQAVAALEAQSQGGIKEIIQSIDTEFAHLLADGDAAAAPAGIDTEFADLLADGDAAAAPAGIDTEFADLLADGDAAAAPAGIDTEFAGLLADDDAAAAPAGQAEGQGSDRREPASKEAESQPAPSEGAKWDPEKESLDALRAITGRL